MYNMKTVIQIDDKFNLYQLFSIINSYNIGIMFHIIGNINKYLMSNRKKSIDKILKKRYCHLHWTRIDFINCQKKFIGYIIKIVKYNNDNIGKYMYYIKINNKLICVDDNQIQIGHLFNTYAE